MKIKIEESDSDQNKLENIFSTDAASKDDQEEEYQEVELHLMNFFGVL